MTHWALRNCKKFVRKLARRLIVHPSLDPALHITVPEGHGSGEMRQLMGSNEGASRKNRRKAEKRKNAREGTCLAPSRGMRERENTGELESEIAAKGHGTKSARNTRSKLRLKIRRANY